MKILRIIPSMNPKNGGPCQGIRNSIPELSKLGVVNEVLSMDNPSESFIGTDPFKIYAIGFGENSWQYNKELIPWLLENLGNYDVVIIHGLWLYHSYATVKALLKYKLIQKALNTPKVYLMPHGMLDPWFQKDKTRRLKAIRNEIYWRLLEKKVVSSVDGLLFTCEQELLLARTTFKGYSPKKELNIGYGIAAPPENNLILKNSFLQKCNGLPQNEKYWLFLGRIDYKKGVDLLIKAYNEVISESDSNKMPYLVIAGPGLETDYGQSLLSLVKKSSRLGERVIFTGMLTGNAKWGAIYGCEAFILPSHQENFGISVAEALACRKTVLISNQVNIWKEIESMEAGIVADDTVEGTALLLRKFNTLSSTEKQQMEANAIEAYQRFFDVSVVAKRLLTLI